MVIISGVPIFRIFMVLIFYDSYLVDFFLKIKSLTSFDDCYFDISL